MKRPYKLIHRKGRNIQVEFEHIPGRCFSSGTDDDLLADKWAAAKVARDKGIVLPGYERMTLGEFAQDFFKPSDPKGFRKRQKAKGFSYLDTEYERRQAYLDNYILPAHGRMMLDSISDVLIEDMILDLKSVKKDKDLSNDTKNKVLAAYSDIMKEAKRLGYISDNPVDNVDRMADNSVPGRAFSEEELQLLFPKERDRLLFVWKSLQWAVYFMVMRDTGWRPGQVSGLTVMDYYPELHGVYTTGSVDWKTREYKNSIKTTRKGQKFCEGFLSDETIELLEELIRYRASQKYLFLLDGRFPSNTTINDHLRDAAARAHVDLDGRTQYSFRHSFQTYFIGRMPESARLILMGHTKTRNEYTHLTAQQSMQRVLGIEGVKQALQDRTNGNQCEPANLD